MKSDGWRVEWGMRGGCRVEAQRQPSSYCHTFKFCMAGVLNTLIPKSACQMAHNAITLSIFDKFL